ncbi:hypothetical protein PFISCL1PPCAC_4515, partial [Pristionchus fissidentatus]
MGVIFRFRHLSIIYFLVSFRSRKSQSDMHGFLLSQFPEDCLLRVFAFLNRLTLAIFSMFITLRSFITCTALTLREMRFW